MADPSKPNFKVPDLLPPRRDRRGPARAAPQEARRWSTRRWSNFEASDNDQCSTATFEAAFRLMTSPQAREAFDLSKEPQTMRERYGMNRFGQCCLLARRLVEAGVRFVTVNTFFTVFNEITWDIHGSKPFTVDRGDAGHRRPDVRPGLHARCSKTSPARHVGNTLVCNLAEFGRTPHVNPAGGRDHWPQCWTVDFAGGGVQGGRVVGRSDAIGGVPAERPVDPAEVVATIYRSLGLDLETKLPGPQGRGRSRWSISASTKSRNLF